MSKKIGVIGCGWLGLPLAISFIKDGYTVHGSTTSLEKIALLTNAGIVPFVISLLENQIQGDIAYFLSDIETLVINVPPKLRGIGPKENYVKKMQLLHQEISKSNITNVIFVSSTSVYGDIEGEVTEDTTPQPSTESGRQILASEHIFKSDGAISTTVIRFGGLTGPNRNPITMLSGRKDIPNGNYPVNLIHLNDCIAIIKNAIYNDWQDEVLNAVYPYHPSKEKYYTKQALALNIEPPIYTKSLKTGKKLISNSLINVKKYKFTTTI